ncbi:MAG: pilus assembly protein TadG-related protein [Actinomycetes bacterium]
MTRLTRDDEGSVLLLGIGLVVVCVLAVAALVDASSAFLQRQKLFAVADAAAVAGAQAIDLPAYYAHGATSATRLEPAAVSATVTRHLERADARRAIPGMVVTRIWSDGQQVVVGLQSPLRLPFLSGLFGGQVAVESWAQLDYRGLG